MAWANYFVNWLSARVESSEEGQGMVEYGLIIALVAVVAAAALILLGPEIANIFTSVTGDLQSVQ